MGWCKLLVLSIALISHGDCRSPRIVHGRDVTIEQFPYQASIRGDDNHYCGGAIISEKHILTAGHCMEGAEPPFDGLTVVTGTSRRNGKGKRHEIAKITMHPQFHFEDSGRTVNDIAVIELKDPIVFDASQQKLDLPRQNFQVGQKANLTGWGKTSENPDKRPDLLQVLETEFVSIHECQKTINELLPIHDTEVCFKRKKDSGVCSGDSGGPVASNGEVFGIVTWISGDLCATNAPDINSNVYKFKDFIESAMK